MNLYSILLSIHSILRWVVLIIAIFVIIRAITGISFKRPYESVDDKAGLWYTILLDTQVLIGLILTFFVSPITAPMWQNMAAVMSNSSIRFFMVEHPVIMVVAVAVAHIGRSRVKKSAALLEKERATMTDRKAISQRNVAIHRTALIFFAISLVLILAGVPWFRLFPGQ